MDTKINADLEKNARVITVEDRPLQDGDQAIIDFEGSIDGKPFALGGQAEEFPLMIGSKTFMKALKNS